MSTWLVAQFLWYEQRNQFQTNKIPQISRLEKFTGNHLLFTSSDLWKYLYKYKILVYKTLEKTFFKVIDSKQKKW